MTAEELLSSGKLLTTADMATIYGYAKPGRFYFAFHSDQKKPRAERRFPAPINPHTGKSFLWRSADVQAMRGQR